MSKVLIVETKSIYGRELTYPVCKDAVLFARLLNVKSFNYTQIEDIKALGYDVVLQHKQDKSGTYESFLASQPKG